MAKTASSFAAPVLAATGSPESTPWSRELSDVDAVARRCSTTAGWLYVPAAEDWLAHKKPEVKPPPPPPEEANLVEKAASMEGSVTMMASRAASLERFECDSWSSSAILDGDEEGAAQSYFDLPLEPIKSSRRSATHSPVMAAFVFESDRKAAVSSTSDRHAKFSTSPGSCPSPPSSASISPTMQKAIEEFHAFSE